MTLLRLPVEVQQEIIANTIPESFEPMMLTCKHLHRIGNRFLEQHNFFRKAFTNFSYQNGRVHNPTPKNQRTRSLPDEIHIDTPVELLQFIAHHPIAARYIRVADLAESQMLLFELCLLRGVRRLITGDKQPLLQLLRSSPYLAEAGCSPEDWLEAVDTRVGGHADLLVLTLLPNVQWISPPKPIFEDMDRSDQMSLMRALVRRANDPAIVDGALSRLEALVSAGSDWRGDARNGLDWFEPFLALKSLSSFTITEKIAFAPKCVFMPLYGKYGDNITEIHLKKCLIGHEEIRAFLGRTPNLKIFSLEWLPMGEFGLSLDIHTLVTVIGRAVGSTLEVLSLTDGGGVLVYGCTSTSMSDFKRLRTLQLSWGMLFYPNIVIQTGRNLTEDGTCVFRGAEACRLVDLLPTTIESVQIHINTWIYFIANDRMKMYFEYYCGAEYWRKIMKACSEYDVKYLLRDFQERCTMELPCLTKLEFIIPEYSPSFVKDASKPEMEETVPHLISETSYKLMKEVGTCIWRP